MSQTTWKTSSPTRRFLGQAVQICYESARPPDSVLGVHGTGRGFDNGAPVHCVALSRFLSCCGGQNVQNPIEVQNEHLVYQIVVLRHCFLLPCDPCDGLRLS